MKREKKESKKTTMESRSKIQEENIVNFEIHKRICGENDTGCVKLYNKSVIVSQTRKLKEKKANWVLIKSLTNNLKIHKLQKDLQNNIYL